MLGNVLHYDLEAAAEKLATVLIHQLLSGLSCYSPACPTCCSVFFMHALLFVGFSGFGPLGNQ
jgi:hypothetical protein